MTSQTCLIRWWSLVGVVGLALLAGCQTPPGAESETGRRDMLQLLMPSRVEIVQPFTRVKTFDEDTQYHGIELLLRAVNYLDNPGLMIVGDVTVELYEYVPASADHRGSQLDNWAIELTTEKDQRRYWNQVTQMYEFRLQINPERVPPADQYVLMVTYNSPFGDHLMDEAVLGSREIGALKRFKAAPQAGND